ncbi:unnamed protein product [Wickerhamomyces anomalus]
MTKKLPLNERLNRKPISRACKFCHQKHLQCDQAHECQDVERKRAKYLSDEQSKGEKSTRKRNHSSSSSSETPDVTSRRTSSVAVNDAKFQPILPNVGDTNHNTASPQITRLINESHSDSPHQQDVFSSLFANQEYTQLTDILDKEGGAETPASSGSNAPVYNTEFQTSFQSDNNTRPYISLSDNSTGTGSIHHLPLVDSNDRDYTSPLIIRHMIKIPEDVYTTQIQSYNYPKAYHALLNYLKTRFTKEQLIKIAEFMADYRPSFIAATRSLVEMDLLFAERSFQRSLLEYESMSSLSSSPTIMWRRTGEIVAVSTEFSSLTSHTKTQLLSKRTFIIELMNDSSALDYFKLFSSVAFGDLNGVIITECTLLSPNGEPIRCASTWTVKRDVFDIPMLIVGQFLPILQVR